MTPTVFAIALLHGVLVLATCVLTNSRVLTNVAAILTCLIAIGTGGSRYAIFDLLAVGGAYFFCITRLLVTRQRSEPSKPVEERAVVPERKGNDVSIANVLVLTSVVLSIMGLATFAYSKLDATRQSLQPPVEPTTQPFGTKPANTVAPTPRSVVKREKNPSSEAQRAAAERRRQATIQDLREGCRPPLCEVVR